MMDALEQMGMGDAGNGAGNGVPAPAGADAAVSGDDPVELLAEQVELELGQLQQHVLLLQEESDSTRAQLAKMAEEAKRRDAQVGAPRGF